jgi:hypothetical protein
MCVVNRKKPLIKVMPTSSPSRIDGTTDDQEGNGDLIREEF